MKTLILLTLLFVAGCSMTYQDPPDTMECENYTWCTNGICMTTPC